MLAKRNLCRFLAALISLSLMFSASSSFAMTGCAQMSKMAMPSNMTMAMPMTGSADASKASHQKAPCKMPAGQCASLCAAMASAALTPLQFAVAIPARIRETNREVAIFVKGIAPPPALPPPILLA